MYKISPKELVAYKLSSKCRLLSVNCVVYLHFSLKILDQLKMNGVGNQMFGVFVTGSIMFYNEPGFVIVSITIPCTYCFYTTLILGYIFLFVEHDQIHFF